MRGRLVTAGAVFGLAVAAGAPTLARTALGAPEITIRLEAGSRSVPQGLAFRFRAELTNTVPSPRLVEVAFNVVRPGNGLRIAFDRWAGVIDAGQTVAVTRRVSPAQWFPGRGRFILLAATRDTQARMRFTVTKSPLRVPRFDDVTAAAGLATTHHAVPTTSCDFAAGAAWGDIEGDGDLDLYLPQQQGPSSLWVNTGGSFIDEATVRGVDNGGRVGVGAVFADYDNDGDQDLYAVNNGPNRLYRNDGSGRFEDVGPQAGVADDGPGTSATWGDYDSDGLLDLYVVNYGRSCEPPGDVVGIYAEDRLYRNQGDGTFADVTQLLHATGSTAGAGFQGAWLDYDGDRDVDLYVANDFIGPRPTANVLWRNDGPAPGGSWTFTNVSDPSGAGVAINAMGLGIGDYERDGDPDIAISNIDATVFLRNNGDGTFTDVAPHVGVDRPRVLGTNRAVTWGLGFVDFNHDRREDLFVVGGSLIHGLSDEQPDALFMATRGGGFLDLSAPSGTNDSAIGRGVAFADYDRDGLVDIYLVNRGGVPRLFRNVTPLGRSARWLAVETVGTRSNRDGCGTRLTAFLGGGIRLMRDVYCGSIGLSSGSDRTVHFGLGDVRQVKSLVIQWPSGTVQVLRDVATNRLLTVTEPS